MKVEMDNYTVEEDGSGHYIDIVVGPKEGGLGNNTLRLSSSYSVQDLIRILEMFERRMKF